MSQFARPDSDVSAGTWGATPLWSKLDETSPSDVDEVTADSTVAAPEFEVGLSNVADPVISTGHIIRARVKYSGTEAPTDAKVELFQGVTLKATLAIGVPTTAYTTYSHTLSGAEADSISNYADLRLRVTFTLAGAGADTTAHCSWLEFEVPSTISVRDGEAWKTVSQFSVRDAETWKSVTGIWVRDAESWKQLR